MAEYVQKELAGSLFSNDRKTSEKHPDWKGDATIGGVKYWVSGWINQGQRGEYISLSFQVKEDRPQQQQPQRQYQEPPSDHPTDEVPF